MTAQKTAARETSDSSAILLKSQEDIPVLSCPNPGQLNAYDVPTLMRWDVVYFERD